MQPSLSIKKLPRKAQIVLYAARDPLCLAKGLYIACQTRVPESVARRCDVPRWSLIKK